MKTRKKVKFKKSAAIHSCQPYNTNIIVFVNCFTIKECLTVINRKSPFNEEAKKELREIFATDEMKQAVERECYSGFYKCFENGNKKRRFIFIQENKDSWAVTSDTISHEVFHAVYSILSYVGITLSPDSEEAFSYLIGHLVSRITSQILKK